MSFPSSAIPGTRIDIDGVPHLYFGGTAYLGMQSDPDFLAHHAAHTRHLGTHWGASRIGNVALPVYAAAEKALAAWLGSPACLTLSSGFLSARLLAEFFVGQGHPCLFSPNCHEALLFPGATREADWDRLGRALARYAAGNNQVLPVVFADATGGSLRPGPVWDLLEPLDRNCILVVDDSHGLGITGPDGSGAWKPLQATGFRELILCGSLGKAMGITGGLIAGSATRLQALRKTSFFAGASPAPPAGLASLIQALDTGLYRQKLEQLREHMSYLWQRVRSVKPLHGQEGYPVMHFNNAALSGHLRRHRVLITEFQYPAEGGETSPSRIVVTAAHSREDIAYLADLLKAFESS